MRRRILLLFLALQVGCASLQSDETYDPGSMPPPPEPEEGWSKEKKAIVLNAAAAVAILGYGFRFWDYGGTGFQVVKEGWFGQDTQFGGADKLGHAYAAYLGAVGFASLYESWGFERYDADLYGALSSMGATTLIEVGDAMSRNGFSYEDLVMDAAGVLFGYARRRSPKFQRLVDFRIEYFPSDAVTKGGRMDIATDYSGYKYLLALKLDGFEALEDTPLQWAELQVGYYTRGYGTSDDAFFDEQSRTLYFGVGINLSRIFRKAGYEKTSRVFNFLQIPYTYAGTDGFGGGY